MDGDSKQLKMTDWISTKQAMEILGVGATTIKRLADEDRLPFIKTPGGHRRFKRSALEALVRQIHKPTGVDEETGRWLQLLKSHPVRQVIAELQRFRLQYTDWYEVSDLLGDVIHRIGDMWTREEYSTVEVQISSSTLQQALGTLAATSAAPTAPQSALLATTTGERHALGLSLTQLCLASSGTDTVWAGTNLPAQQLASYIDAADVEIVALSASEWSSDHVSLADSYRVIAEACKRKSIELILGGQGAWTDDLHYGHRCNSFAELRAVVAAL